MATNVAFKITKDTSARKNTRVGTIQSAVEAAAMKESHDYYVERLTEGYKQQLETMEQSYEEQIRELKLQLTTAVEKMKEDTTKEAATKTDKLIQEAEAKLSLKDEQYKGALADCRQAMNYATRLEKDKNGVETRYRAQIVEQSKAHEAALDETHHEKNTGPYHWIEIKFIKRNKSKMAEPRFAVKRGGVSFSELAQAALNSKSIHSWTFEYHGRPVTNMEKTLTAVSLVLKEMISVMRYY